MEIIQKALFLLPFFSVSLHAETDITEGLIVSQLNFPPMFKPPQTFQNINLMRLINLEKAYPQESINVVIKNVAQTAQDEYFIPLTARQKETIGTIEVKDKNNPDQHSFKVQFVKVESNSDTWYYRVRLPKPLTPESQLTIGITFSYLSALNPKPATIPQGGSQFLIYNFCAHALTAYPTLTQQTDIKFPNSNVAEYTTILNEKGESQFPVIAGSRYTYGPFTKVPPGVFEPITVRYQSIKPLIHVLKLERDVEISHWGGNAAFEERYTLTNRAANLSKPFSRVEWASSNYYNPPTTAIKELTFPLKVGSLTPYYIDVIGNVSTSRFRTSSHEASLEVKPRYPIFGGWNYPFRIGWDANVKKFLRKLPGNAQYILNVPFLEGPTQAEGVEYKLVELRIILPEGAKNLRFSTSVPLISAEISTHKTYMDTIGRTTLTLNAINLFDSLRDRELVVTYEYLSSAMLRKPLVIFSAFLGLFTTTWVVGSFDMSIQAKSL
ncbi:Bgt-312 [Blumeria graminis f. sp. tritici]|uniref:Dolichyl-diphosphooligosaccharide--protein glycosyltransferase subunit 1 n=3 Tax=Blumeria graminis TaxID=34373 RepID=A0A9X9MKM6_BLUGR|nr:Alpha subunit of the oligosaccharyltransferase complex of the ER lumen [Blumeria graminis f. sp. tritici 96224]VDB91034.1 Bgt-312 [Blumeria graminis f. sp. tritici]